MAYRYPAEWFETDDVVTPDEWLLNVREFADEFNAALDRDNLPDGGLNEARLSGHCCTDLEEQVFTGAFSPVADTIEWQTVTTDTYDTTTDPEILQVEFSCWWSWPDVSMSAAPANIRADRSIRFRITVDGHTVAEGDFISRWLRKASVYLCGAIAVPAGRHIINADCQVGVEKAVGVLTSGARSVKAISVNLPTVQEGDLTTLARRR